MRKYIQYCYKARKWIIAVAMVFTVVMSYNFAGDDFEIGKNLDIFATLYKELNNNYVDEIKPGELIKTAIDAMLESLDPYTVYIPESELEDYKMMTTGEYGGIGALIHKTGDYIIISVPYDDSPAQKNDIRAGDTILEINNKSMKGKNTEDITNILRGQAGATVKILLKREGEKNPIEKNIERKEIKINNVSYSGMVDENVGYIKLSNFFQDAGKEVKTAFLDLKEKGMKNCILDLRGNGGGLLNEAVNIVNIFIDKNILVVSTKGKVKVRNTEHKTLNNAADSEIPLVVLVDRGSASASEIVAGAIQDIDRGVIIGERTYGKGLVQNVVSLSYNTKMKVTIAKYYIPSGRCIQAIDYSQKNEDGSVAKIPDSLKVAFKTKKGRTVYDGGGIEPDMYIKPYEYSDIAASLVTKLLVFNFATKFRSQHESIAPVNEFKITDEIYKQFISYIADKDYDYTTASESSLAELKKNAEDEKYYNDIATEYEALKNKMMHNKKEDLEKYKDEITDLLRIEIVSRYYFQKGQIQASLLTDPEVKKAQELFNDTKKFSGILDGSVVLNKEK
ncbi:MAG TPA: S41 family peptidase [Bacteroidales bacterium]|nr:S41 family peptidase [Bacteroidales bacterium]HPS16030.1 S41 family peptidase [Bacteroidales bacterium]